MREAALRISLIICLSIFQYLVYTGRYTSSPQKACCCLHLDKDIKPAAEMFALDVLIVCYNESDPVMRSRCLGGTYCTMQRTVSL